MGDCTRYATVPDLEVTMLITIELSVPGLAEFFCCVVRLLIPQGNLQIPSFRRKQPSSPVDTHMTTRRSTIMTRSWSFLTRGVGKKCQRLNSVIDSPGKKNRKNNSSF